MDTGNKVLFPRFVQEALSRTYLMSTDIKLDMVMLVYLKSKTKCMKRAEEKSKWLAARIETKSIKLIIE